MNFQNIILHLDVRKIFAYREMPLEAFPNFLGKLYIAGAANEPIFKYYKASEFLLLVECRI